MFKTLIEAFIGFFGCFLAIHWLPFSQAPFTIDTLLETILNPIDFFLGAISFLIGFLAQSRIFRDILKEWRTNHLITKDMLGLFGLVMLPSLFLIFSIKVVVSFFLFTLFYGIISLDSTPSYQTNKQQKE